GKNRREVMSKEARLILIFIFGSLLLASLDYALDIQYKNFFVQVLHKVCYTAWGGLLLYLIIEK
ncbi:MAG: hypothetical protein WAU31_01475, partial [Candidatus Moraniibacteriota bacterium]